MRLTDISIAVVFIVSSFSSMALAQGSGGDAAPSSRATSDASAPKKAATPKRKKNAKKPAPPPEQESAVAEPTSAPLVASAKRPESAPAPAPVEESAPPPKKDAPASAPAAELPAMTKPFSIAPLFGYATSHANLGLGVRGGYTVNGHIYVGGSFIYHVGSSEEQRDPMSGTTSEMSVSMFYTGAEVGYDLPLGPVILRPYGGVGALFVHSSSKLAGQEQSGTASSFAFWPGCAVTYDVPESRFFVGGDTRLVIATEGGDPSFGMFATGGARF